MFGFVRGRAVAVVFVVAGLVGGVTAGSVAAAQKTTVTWKVSSLKAGQAKNLSNVASTNSPGVKTWSKTGSCVLSPKSKPTKLTMGSTGSCTLTLKIAKSGNYLAKTSSKTIILALYGVGDTGPGDGKIFYVDMTRAVGSQYFEAACAGWQNNCDGMTADPTADWGCNGESIIFADATAIGTGEGNTARIVDGCSDPAGFAADLAADYSNSGESDWFLPSKDELKKLWLNKESVGGLSSANYWSSSEDDDNYAWDQDFDDGVQYNGYKFFTLYVRPVRSF